MIAASAPLRQILSATAFVSRDELPYHAYGTVDEGEYDYVYLTDIKAGDELRITVSPYRECDDPDIYLYDPDGTLVDYSMKVAGADEVLDVTASKDGTYKLRIYGLSGDGGVVNFNIDILLVSAVTTTTTTVTTPPAVTTPTTSLGKLFIHYNTWGYVTLSRGCIAVYGVDPVCAGDEIKVDIVAHSGDPDGAIYDSEEYLLISSGEEGSDSFKWTAGYTGKYFVKVWAYTGTTYDLTITVFSSRATPPEFWLDHYEGRCGGEYVTTTTVTTVTTTTTVAPVTYTTTTVKPTVTVITTTTQPVIPVAPGGMCDFEPPECYDLSGIPGLGDLLKFLGTNWVCREGNPLGVFVYNIINIPNIALNTVGCWIVSTLTSVGSSVYNAVKPITDGFTHIGQSIGSVFTKIADSISNAINRILFGGGGV